MRAWFTFASPFVILTSKTAGENLSFHPPVGGFTCWLHVASRRERTGAVADMLLVNKQLENVSFYDDTIDCAIWDTFVAPRIECNWFFPLKKIAVPSTHAAVVARALAPVESKAWLVWMLLSQNHDIISSNFISAPDTS
jgi:hypothetical protein